MPEEGNDVFRSDGKAAGNSRLRKGAFDATSAWSTQTRHAGSLSEFSLCHLDPGNGEADGKFEEDEFEEDSRWNVHASPL